MSIQWTKIHNDCNGNPRQVCHFLNLIPDVTYKSGLSLTERYAIACKRANKIGGRKYHCKAYGGGIVFQSYSIQNIEKHIERTITEDTTNYNVVTGE